MLPLIRNKFIAIAFLFASNSLFGQGLAIEGYSPVSYFQQGMAERGNEQFSANYEGSVYFLTSKEQLDLFTSNPEKYTPRFGEYCPYSLKTGMRKTIDPKRFKIVGGSLLLFHYSDELDAKSEWDKGDDKEQLFEAREEFVLFTF